MKVTNLQSPSVKIMYINDYELVILPASSDLSPGRSVYRKDKG